MMMDQSEEAKVLKCLPNFLNTFGTKFTNCICCGEDIIEESFKEESRRSRQVLKDICIKSVAYENKVLKEGALEEDSSFPFCEGCVTSTILKLTETYRQLQAVQEGFNEVRHTLVSDLIRCYVRVFFGDDNHGRHYPTEESIFNYWRKCALRNTWESYEEPETELSSDGTRSVPETQRPKRIFDLSKVKIEDSEEEIVLEGVGIVACNNNDNSGAGEDIYDDGFDVDDFYNESIVSVREKYFELKHEPAEPAENNCEIAPSAYGLRKSLDAVIDDDLAPINQVVANALGNFRPELTPASDSVEMKTRKNTNSKVKVKRKNLKSKVFTAKPAKKKKPKGRKSTTAVTVYDDDTGEVTEPRRSTRFQSLKKISMKKKLLRSATPKKRGRPPNKKLEPTKANPKSVGRKCKSQSPNENSKSEPKSINKIDIVDQEINKNKDEAKYQPQVKPRRALRSSLENTSNRVPKTENSNESPKIDSSSFVEAILPDSPYEIQSQDDFFETEENSCISPNSPSCISEEELKASDSSDSEFEPPKKKRAVIKKKKSSPNQKTSNEPTKEVKKRIRKSNPKSKSKNQSTINQEQSSAAALPSSTGEPSDLSSDTKAKKGRKPPRPVQCSVCGKILCSSYNLTLHMRTHTGEKPYPCPHCPMRFLKPPNLKAHLLKHTREKQYCCELCGATFGYPQVLRSHKASLHQIYDHVYKFECNSSDGNCHKKYITPGEMAKHLRQTHFVDLNSDISPYCKIQCVACNLNLPDMNNFNEHIKGEEHANKLKARKNPTQTGPERSDQNRNGDHGMDRAGATNSASISTPTSNANEIPIEKTDPQSVLLSSIKSDLTSQWPKKCRAEGCDMMVSSETNMRLHLQKCHRQRSHICDVCNKAFMEKAVLRQHKIIHLDPGERPFCCDECDDRFNTLSGLKRHKMKHTGEGLQTCKYCDKGFTKLKVYRKHMCIQHPDQYLILERHFCDCCFLTFRSEEELINHRKVHEEFGCEQCGKLFEYHCELVRHIQNHDNKPYKCDQCDKSWVREKELKDHVARRHSREKSFKCDQCGLAFYGEKWLNNHINRLHSGTSGSSNFIQKTRQKNRREKYTESSTECSDDDNEDTEASEEDDGQDPLRLDDPITEQQLVYNSANPEDYMVQVHLLPNHSHSGNREELQ